MQKLISQLEKYTPFNEQEERDKNTILNLLKTQPDIFERSNLIAHMTASAWVVNKDRSKILLAYHNIYDSWAWLGGHADGETDLLHVAMREAKEETGIEHLRLIGGGVISLEILPVWAHVKRGRAVGSHLHLNVSYLFEADDTLPLRVAEDENSAVGWLGIDRLDEYVSERDMLPTYRKILNRTNVC